MRPRSPDGVVVNARFSALFALLLGWATAAFPQSYTFTHFAGSSGGPGTIDASGSAARFDNPWGIARDSVSGNLYVVDDRSRSIRVVTPSNQVTTLVGWRNPASGTGGRRSEVSFGGPRHLTIDGSGNLYLADKGYHVILRITQQGEVTTLAGSYFSHGATNGTGTDATFNGPEGIAFDAASGNFYVADTENHIIRRITPAGVVTTLAGLAGEPGTANGTGSVARFFRPRALATDTAGNIYVADTDNHAIRKITPGGAVSTLAGLPGESGFPDGTGTDARFFGPEGIAVDAAGFVYVADTIFHRIRIVSPGGEVTTLAQGFGHMDGPAAGARFWSPRGLTVDASGNLYVADWGNHSVRIISDSGIVSTPVGKPPVIGAADGTGDNAQFSSPENLALDSSGNLFVADAANGTIRKITSGGSVSTFAGMAEEFLRPTGVSSDASDNLYVADQSAHTIHKVTPAGVVTTFAGLAGSSGTANGTTEARFNEPYDTATDADGNVYVAERGNHAIRKITPEGVVSTLAGLPGTSGAVNGTGTDARFDRPISIASDSSGNLFVADESNAVIRKITPEGVVTTFAGGMGIHSSVDGVGTAARFITPRGIAIDSLDNVYVGGDNLLRHITSGGIVTTIGGTQLIHANEDGTGSFARFSRIAGLAVNGSGRIFISDIATRTIRVGDPALNAAAAIDQATGTAFVTRQLSTSPNPGTTWQWDLIRKPTGSTATFSSSSVHNPTFTPDVADRYVFRLTTSAISPISSITQVVLTASCPTIAITPASLPHPIIGSSYSEDLGATNSNGPSFAVTAGDLPGGLTLSPGGTLSGNPSKAGTFTFTITATDVAACPVPAREYTVTVGTLPAPIGLVATGSSTVVSLSWNPVGGAAGYRIYRKGPGAGAFTDVGTSAGPGFDDTSVAIATTYLYRVRALDGSLIESADSNSDLATTFVFTNPTLVPGVTEIRRPHITQLRTVVNQVRSLAGLAGASFTDTDLTGMRIKAVHITQLRSALTEARTELGLDLWGFADPSLSGVTAQSLHVTEIRQALQ